LRKLLSIAVLLACFSTVTAHGADLAAGVKAYERGDYAAALRIFRELARQGDAGAQFKLGIMYYDGKGVPQDYVQAYMFFNRAAAQGYKNARDNRELAGKQIIPPADCDEDCAGRWFQYRAAGALAYSTRDYATALRINRQLADQGDAAAQHSLGFMYGAGMGVRQDYAEALKWFLMAANQGIAEAQFNLGFMCQAGKGVPQDYVQAHMWFSLAAEQGLEPAKRNRDRIAKRMTPGQIAEAQKLVREWKIKRLSR
jgi:TPR repeat protein